MKHSKRLFIVGFLFSLIPAWTIGQQCTGDCCTFMVTSCCVTLESLLRFGYYMRGPKPLTYPPDDPVWHTCFLQMIDCPNTEFFIDKYCSNDRPLPGNYGAFCTIYDCTGDPRCPDTTIIAECQSSSASRGTWRHLNTNEDGFLDLRDYAFLQNQFGR